MKITEVVSGILDIPVRRPHKMSFGTLRQVNYVLVRVRTDAGLEGLGEAAVLGGPTWSEESAESVLYAIRQYLAPAIQGLDPTNLEVARRQMNLAARGNPFAKAALEMALFDITGKAWGVPVYSLLGGKVHERIPLSWSLATGEPDEEIKEALALMERGHRIFKVKVAGLPPERDAERLAALRRSLGPEAKIRVDANQGWDATTAIRAIRMMEPAAIEFAEQPVPRWDRAGLDRVARAVGVPIMADESLMTVHDALDLAGMGSISIFALKLEKSGGFLESRRIAQIAEAAGIGCYVGCMIETGVGTSAYAQFAASCTPLKYGCELFGPLLLADDIVKERTIYEDGHIVPFDRPGLGVTLDHEKVEKYTRGRL